MITETKKVFALAALIVATGIATVELTRTPAQADSRTFDTAAYAASRIDAAFEVVAQMPAMPPVRVPMIQKGDLEVPAGCEGAGEAECMDVAYEVPSEPSLVVETRTGTTSTLMRMDAMTVASDVKKDAPQSE